MKALKIGLFLVMGMVTSIILCNEQDQNSYIVHVGDVITIPIGRIDQNFGPYHKNCSYEVANPEEIYFAYNPAGATNILRHHSWDYDNQHAIHQVIALRPGKITIRYNRIPDLEDCGCDEVPLTTSVEKIPSSTNGFIDVNVVGDANRMLCLQACNEEKQKQMHKDYKIITVTVLPFD